MICTLCGKRRAKRACPALGRQICPVCCGTKRLVEIECPSDCAYLAASREHPAIAVVRRQRQDLQQLLASMRDLNERQSRLFFLLGSFLTQYQPDELQAVADEDVAEAAAAMASTLETAARGVIYDHRPASPAAERLATAMKSVLEEAGKGAGSAFDRDAAVVLRRVEEAARGTQTPAPGESRSFLDLLGRVLRRADAPPSDADTAEPRIIVP